MRKFHLEIVTPDGVIFDGDAEGILVRTDGGDLLYKEKPPAVVMIWWPMPQQKHHILYTG